VGERVTGEGLSNKADPKDGVAVGGGATGPGALAKASHRYIAIAHGADDDRGHLGVDEEDLPGASSRASAWATLAPAAIPATATAASAALRMIVKG